ncbi:MAG: M20/M25/M40 family metallo-hydrolase [Acutalibacteraceae bacterium]|nr:M20/M25/M40 family metallo-hydrolase [Acutalibacteraceae bacterium]
MLYILLGVVLLFILVLLIRTLTFKPINEFKPLENEELFDGDKATENLQKLVQCATVSYKDSSLEDEKEFEKFIALLPDLYKNVYKNCKLLTLPDRALLFKWEGKNHETAAVMMAHYDVVPVNQKDWEKDAFSGLIEDGVMWGRGTLDTKATFNGIMTAADHLIAEGFVPENDIYFAFSGGEEVNGQGAVNIVNYFEENGIKLAFVVDEGGAVVENVFPGVKAPCGLIGIAEKGMMNVAFTAKSSGGHASAPKPNSPIVRLSNACCNIEHYPTKSKLSTPVAYMFDTLGRHSNFLYKMIFSNLWLFSGVLDMICKKSGGELNALMRTTIAFTQSAGSSAANVIPPEATLISNIRINPCDTVSSTLDYLKKTVNDKDIEISIMDSMEPSRISKVDCDEFDKVALAVASTWKGTIISPYLMVQCSDSRHYGRISDKVYRFSAMDLTSEERATIHGNNERIRLETISKAVEFYIRLMRQC